MDPVQTPAQKPTPNPKSKEPTVEEQAKTDAYAQSLLRTVTLDFDAKQAQKPKTKHFVSKKLLIYLIVSILLTIALWVAGATIGKQKNKEQSDQKTEELINNVENFNNPNTY